MVKIIPFKMESEPYSKKIICFGAGKFFKRFVKEYDNLNVAAVVDNYLSKQMSDRFCVEKVRLIDFQEFINVYNENIMVIITTKHYADLIQQMDEEESLTDIECYIYDWWDRKPEEVLELYEKLDQQRCMFQSIENVPDNQRKFQLWNGVEVYFNAGTKAPQDVKQILSECNYMNINVHPFEQNVQSEQRTWQKKRNELDWQKCANVLSEGSVIFLQHLGRQGDADTATHIWRLKETKKVKIISLLHDIEVLRIVCATSNINKEFEELLKYTDVFIVHNKYMKKYLESLNVSGDKIVCLEIFDYLTSNAVPNHVFSRDVIIAGNFDSIKSGYAQLLHQVDGTLFHLFGLNYIDRHHKNVLYHGAVSPEAIIEALPDGFGLVWDGDSLDTCSGNTGQYLRYNNPHKLSLYIASGLPIIIWEEAAEKDFVIENNLGLAIKSLRDLPEVLSHVTDTQYDMYRDNVKRIAEKVCQGEYTKNAIRKAEHILFDKPKTTA